MVMLKPKKPSIIIKNNFENTIPVNIPVPMDKIDIIVFSIRTYFFICFLVIPYKDRSPNSFPLDFKNMEVE